MPRGKPHIGSQEGSYRGIFVISGDIQAKTASNRPLVVELVASEKMSVKPENLMICGRQ